MAKQTFVKVPPANLRQATITLEFANYGDSVWRGDLRRWRKAGIAHEVLPVECHFGAMVKLTGAWLVLRAYIVNVYAPNEPAMQLELLASMQ